MNVTIRKVGPDDVDGVYRVYHETWLSTYPSEEYGISFDDILDKLPKDMSAEVREKRRALYVDVPLNRTVFVALDEESIVGVCAGVTNDEFTQLKSIYVLPEYQGQGIGQKLWESFREWAGVTPKYIVHVAIYNMNAIKFYEKLGFKDTGKRFTEERFKFKSGSSIPEMEMEMIV